MADLRKDIKIAVLELGIALASHKLAARRAAEREVSAEQFKSRRKEALRCAQLVVQRRAELDAALLQDVV